MPAIDKNFYLPLARRHVMADRWQDTAGTDFWLVPALLGGTTVAGSNRIIDNGWTLEAEHGVGGSGGDFRGGTVTMGTMPFGSPSDPGIPTHYALILTGDLIVSPPVFGTYDHMAMAAAIAGRGTLPTKMITDVRAAFTVNSADEVTSGFGLFEDATTTTSATEALQHAFISSNGTNFRIACNASTTNVDLSTAVDDAAWHFFRMVYYKNNAGTLTCDWYIDGVKQGYVSPIEDEFPLAFGAHVLTTNTLLLGPVHIWYDWS